MLLSVRKLSVTVRGAGWAANAVDNVDLDVGSGEIVGVVGESGSGKTLTALSILRLIDPPLAITHGQIVFDGRDVLAMPPRELRSLRGQEIGTVFQDPYASIDPSFTIGDQMLETVHAHQRASKEVVRAQAIDILGQLGVASPARRLGAYPHEFSGGMLQRVMIGMALLLAPRLLIADEPTSALDVTTQAQLLDVIRRLRDDRGMGVILISHDLGAVIDVCDRVVVMYAGEVVEVSDATQLRRDSRHPYTQALLQSKLGLRQRRRALPIVPGQIPQLTNRPAGCRFNPRCSNVIPKCVEEHPDLEPRESARLYRCFNPSTWVEP